MLEEACNQEKEEVCPLKKIVERDQQKTLSQQEHLVERHMVNVCSISRRADTAEKAAAADEDSLQAIYA